MVGRFAAGDPPPLLYSSDHWLQEWASAGWLAPLDVSFPSAADYSGELAPYALQGMTYDGHVYGMSYYADTIDFVYNSDQLTQAGFDAAPATWEELWDMSMALKEQGIAEYPLILAFSQQEGASIEAMISMIYGRHAGEGALFDASNQPTFAAKAARLRGHRVAEEGLRGRPARPRQPADGRDRPGEEHAGRCAHLHHPAAVQHG